MGACQCQYQGHPPVNRSYVGLASFAGLAVIAAMGSAHRKTPTNRVYREFCGPPYPATRQQRRALMRKAGIKDTRHDRT